MRLKSALENRVPKPQRGLPEVRRHEACTFVTSPGIINEDIQPPLLFANSLEESFYVVLICVIASRRNTGPAAPRDFLSRVIDCARQAIGGWLSPDTAAGDVDRCTVLAEDGRDSTACAAAGTGDDCKSTKKV